MKYSPLPWTYNVDTSMTNPRTEIFSGKDRQPIFHITHNEPAVRQIISNTALIVNAPETYELLTELTALVVCSGGITNIEYQGLYEKLKEQIVKHIAQMEQNHAESH